MRRQKEASPEPTGRALDTGPDDLTVFLEEELAEPVFRDAYEDAGVREALLRTLLQARQTAELTQGAVAERMGTTQSAISELEGGASDPRLSTLQRYARAVGCRLAAWATPAVADGDTVLGACSQEPSPTANSESS